MCTQKGWALACSGLGSVAVMVAASSVALGYEPTAVSPVISERPATSYLAPAPIQRYPVAASYKVSTGQPTAGSPIVATPATVSAPVLVTQPVVSGYPVYRVQRPLVPAASSVPDGVYLGKGIIGQPKLYVSGQPLRNVLRYLSP